MRPPEDLQKTLAVALESLSHRYGMKLEAKEHLIMDTNLRPPLTEHHTERTSNESMKPT